MAPANKIEIEMRFLPVHVLPNRDLPDAPTGPRIRVVVRRVGSEQWKNIPSNFGSETEATLAAREWLNENELVDDIEDEF